MKYVSALAVVVTIGITGVVRAESPARKAPPITVVEVMSDTGQALVKDEIRDEYVVVRVGHRLNHYEITAITGGKVELTAVGNNTVRYVLAPDRPARESGLIDPYAQAPERIPTVVAPPQSRAAETAVDARTGPPVPAESEVTEAMIDERRSVVIEAPEPEVVPAEPIEARAVPTEPVEVVPAEPIEAEAAPAEPVPAGQDAPPEFELPEAQAELGVPTEDSPIEEPDDSAPPPESFGAPVPKTAEPEASNTEATPADDDPSGVKEAIEAVTGKPSASVGPTAGGLPIARRELDAALADFHALSRELRLRLVDGGVRIDALTEGTLFHRIGLRSGDLVRRVDDRPITGIGDAAALYGRLDQVRDLSVELVRAGQPVVLHYRLVD